MTGHWLQVADWPVMDMMGAEVFGISKDKLFANKSRGFRK